MPLEMTTAELLRAASGVTETHDLGELSETMVARYADAIGESGNAIYHDLDAARRAGFAAIPAPPNLLVSVMSWGRGADDGAGHGADLVPLTDISTDELLVMGGGEGMTFHRPALCGERIRQDTELIDVAIKQGSKGLLAVMVYRHRFTGADGEPILTSDRTILVR